MPRPTAPPTWQELAAPRPPAGTSSLTLVLGPLELELSGLDESRAALLFERYTPYARRGGAATADALRVRVALENVDYFLDPPVALELVQVRIACDGDRVRYMSYQIAGCFDVGGGGGVLLLSRGQWEPVLRSFENYVRAAVAWQAIGRGGGLVHAASATREGKGYLFYGESGAGKSTLSACNRRGQVLSDDLSLVLPGSRGGLDLVGTPFRGTYTGGGPVVGRFPLAAGFRLIQAPRAAVRSVSRLRAMAELVGNLPFVAEAFAQRTDLFERAIESFGGLPLAHLHFAKDDTYWDAIEAAGL